MERDKEGKHETVLRDMMDDDHEPTITDVVTDRAQNIVKKLREKLTDSELIVLTRILEIDSERVVELLTHEASKVISNITKGTK